MRFHYHSTTVLLLILFVAAFFGHRFCASTSVHFDEEAEYLEGITPEELLAFHESISVTPPKDIDKAREIVRKCEELWSELQSFNNEPDFVESHLSEGTPHHDWLLRAQALNRSLPPKEEIGSEVHALPGWLIGAAFDLSGQHQIPGWKFSIEERFAKYQLPVAKKAVQFTP